MATTADGNNNNSKLLTVIHDKIVIKKLPVIIIP